MRHVTKTTSMTVGGPNRDRVVVERFLRAPRKLVWKTLTDPAHLAHWIGPRDYQLLHAEMTVRSGGKGQFVWLDPEGEVVVLNTTLLEVVPCDRLSCVEAWSHGGPGGMTLLTLVDQDEGTLLRRCTWLDVTMPLGTADNLDRLPPPGRMGWSQPAAAAAVDIAKEY